MRKSRQRELIIAGMLMAQILPETMKNVGRIVKEGETELDKKAIDTYEIIASDCVCVANIIIQQQKKFHEYE
jgi:hypothetical protein